MPAATTSYRKRFAPLAAAIESFGDWLLFVGRAASGIFRGTFRRAELLRVAVEVGVASVGVVAITGAFIGMVLAVQAYGQFHTIGLDTSLGAVIHMSVVRELGPVLAAVMLAGRVGSAMAAELATMRVTEQLDCARMPRGRSSQVSGRAARPRVRTPFALAHGSGRSHGPGRKQLDLPQGLSD